MSKPGACTDGDAWSTHAFLVVSFQLCVQCSPVVGVLAQKLGLDLCIGKHARRQSYNSMMLTSSACVCCRCDSFTLPLLRTACVAAVAPLA